MRLTLRTLLAYLDDILEPSDADDLAAKVKESEFATGLVQRIRNAVGRLRLSAPPVLGRGMEGDPNYVSEYLDNTLPADRVPEFEKICLESDVRLAEVAACHQVLALVLGEPAEVATGVRDRVYRVPQVAAERAATPAAGADFEDALELLPGAAGGDRALDAAVAPVPMINTRSAAPSPRRMKPEVPDYLRAGRSRRYMFVAATLAVAFCLGLMAIGVVSSLDGRRADEHATAPHSTAGDPEGAAPSAPIGPLDTDDPDAFPSTPPLEGDNTVASGVGADTAAETLAADGPSAAEPPPEPTDRPPAPTPVPPAEVARQLPPSPLPAAKDPANNAATTSSSLPSLPADPSVATPGASDPPLDTDPIESDDPAVPAEEEVPSEAAGVASVADVAKLTSERQVLLMSDSSADGWSRLAVHESLTINRRYVAPPAFRPEILFGNGMHMTAVGPTAIEVRSIDSAEVAELQCPWGRFFAVTASAGGSQLPVRLGNRAGTLTLGDAESMLAGEVQRVREPGTDPATPEHVVTRIWAARGRVGWQEKDQPVQPVEAGEVLVLVDDKGAFVETTDEAPDWISPDNKKRLDNLALPDIEKELKLNGEKPVAVALDELTQHRKREIRSLAVRCLAYLDQFDPAIMALADDKQHPSWGAIFDALKDAMARGEDSAEKLQQSIGTRRGADSQALVRMLWGYRPDELPDQPGEKGSGEAARLVGYLDHESLDFRVLAYENIRRILGTEPLYRPHATPEVRRRHAILLQRLLDKGQFRYKSPPSVLPAPVG